MEGRPLARADVVLVPFPFTDLSAIKLRPAVIVLAVKPQQLREVVVDGQLAAAVTVCGNAPCNLALIELQNGVPTGLAPGGTVVAASSPRNGRTFVTVDWSVLPGRDYAVVARVTQQRASTATPIA